MSTKNWLSAITTNLFYNSSEYATGGQTFFVAVNMPQEVRSQVETESAESQREGKLPSELYSQCD
jgi:hypothetical protein